MNLSQIDTPAVAVDLDKLEANILRVQRHLDECGIAGRPHIKTHKIPEIARMQVDAGAIGITCQKISEAEVMADAGINDIFIPYNVLGSTKLERLMNLARRATISVTADSQVVAEGLSRAAMQAGIEIPVLVEFDSGLNRCGVQSPEEAAELARTIVGLPGLHFAGLMTYPSSEKLDTFVQETEKLLEVDHVSLERISGGGSQPAMEAELYATPTEHRAGMYVYGDRSGMRGGWTPLETCALTVIATVVSRPVENRAILDSGSKSLSADLVGFEDFGLILEYPDARIYNLSEEHGFVDLSMCATKPEIGERVTIIPNHCCLISNLFDQVYGLRGDEVKVVWPVAARGALQ